MAPSHVKPNLSIAETLSLIAHLPLIVIRLFYAFFQRLSIQNGQPERNIRRAFFLAAAKTLPTGLSMRQLQFIVPPTNVTVAKHCKQHGLPLSTVEVETDNGFPPATLHFVSLDAQASPSTAASQTTLLYIHGGGYVFSMSDGHIEFALLAARAARATTLVLLEYTLAPTHSYPTQIAQAAAALQYLVAKRHIAPHDLILGGDSAGASISLGLLSHAKTPHARIAPLHAGLLVERRRKLKGVLLISPACSMDTTSASYERNAAKDYITPEAMAVFGGALRPTKGEVWSKPLAGDVAYWADVGAERVLLVAGDDEVFRDDIVKLADLMGAKAGEGERVALAVVPGELHAQSVIDFGVGVSDGKTTTAILSWLRSL